MKRVYYIFILLCISSISYAQVENNIILTSQEDINNFKNTYPGLEVIDGILEITDASNDIVSLDSLIGIKKITQDLIIKTEVLLTLSGLDSLVFIGRNLILDEGDINDISALYKLDTIGGNFKTYYLSLTYDGLLNLKYIGEALFICGNGASSFSGFESLNHVGAICLWNNPSLTNISFMDGVGICSKSDNTYVQILLNPSLTECAYSSFCNTIRQKKIALLIRSNGSGCNSRFQIIEECDAKN